MYILYDLFVCIWCAPHIRPFDAWKVRSHVMQMCMASRGSFSHFHDSVTHVASNPHLSTFRSEDLSCFSYHYESGTQPFSLMVVSLKALERWSCRWSFRLCDGIVILYSLKLLIWKCIGNREIGLDGVMPWTFWREIGAPFSPFDLQLKKKKKKIQPWCWDLLSIDRKHLEHFEICVMGDPATAISYGRRWVLLHKKCNQIRGAERREWDLVREERLRLLETGHLLFSI